MKWISVSDRLPEYEDEVLIWFHNCPVEIGLYNQKNEFHEEDYWTCKEYMEIDVSHWMPLPEPPKD